MSTSHGRWLGASSWPSLRRAGAILGLASLAFAPVVGGEEPPPVPAPAPAPAPTPAPEGGGAPAVPPAPPVAPGAGTAANGLRVGREAMWPAPTADDWKKPCLITWQRTWEDALAVSKETGKPILVCINMDGEIASEHYAGVRYRQPEIAALYEPYVTRHRLGLPPHAARLRRRRGAASSARASAASPAASTSRWRRRSTRSTSTASASRRATSASSSTAGDLRRLLRERHRVGLPVHQGRHREAGRAPPPVVVRGDRPIVERVESRAIQDRLAVEAAYQQGDAALRQSLLEAARQAPRGGAPRPAAARAVRPRRRRRPPGAPGAGAGRSRRTPTDLIVEALRVPMDPAERAALLAALGKLGESSPRARWLAVVQQGLSAHSTEVDDKGWTPPAGDAQGAARPRLGRARGASSAGRRAPRRRRRRTRPPTSSSRRPPSRSPSRRRGRSSSTRAWRRCSRATCSRGRGATPRRPRSSGATGWRANTVLALTSYYTGDVPEAYARAGARGQGDPRRASPAGARWRS